MCVQIYFIPFDCIDRQLCIDMIEDTILAARLFQLLEIGMHITMHMYYFGLFQS